MDRRIKKTKTILIDSLADLILEKGFYHLTVVDITTRADINRGTFYLHYQDKFDMLEQVQTEIVNVLSQNILNAVVLISQKGESPINIITNLIKFFCSQKIFKSLLCSDISSQFETNLKSKIITNLLDAKVIPSFVIKNLLVPLDYLITYILSAHLGIIKYWFETNLEKPHTEIAEIIFKMFIYGPFKMTGVQLPNSKQYPD